MKTSRSRVQQLYFCILIFTALVNLCQRRRRGKIASSFEQIGLHVAAATKANKDLLGSANKELDVCEASTLLMVIF